MTDAILLDGIQLPAALGVTPDERAMRRPVRLDLELECDVRHAGRTDRLEDSIDYARVFALVERVVSSQEHHLLEALAERIAAAVLGAFPVVAVTVTARKPSPLAGVVDFTGVRLHRRRRASELPAVSSGAVPTQ